MKNLQIENLGLVVLSNQEISNIDGGNFWYDMAYIAGAVVHGLIYMGEQAQGNPHI
jgi:hypothetical protein